MTTDTHLVSQDPVIEILSFKLSSRLGVRLKKIWLFGSRSRGDARPDCDYDVLVGVDGPEAVTSEIVLDEGYDLMYNESVLDAAITYTRRRGAWLKKPIRDEYSTRGDPSRMSNGKDAEAARQCIEGSREILSAVKVFLCHRLQEIQGHLFNQE